GRRSALVDDEVRMALGNPRAAALETLDAGVLQQTPCEGARRVLEDRPRVRQTKRLAFLALLAGGRDSSPHFDGMAPIETQADAADDPTGRKIESAVFEGKPRARQVFDAAVGTHALETHDDAPDPATER